MEERPEMSYLNHSVQIKRPINEIFTFISDFQNDWKWRSFHIESQKLINNGEVEIISTSNRFPFLRQKVSGTHRIMHYHPNKFISSTIDMGNLIISDTRIVKYIQFNQTQLEYWIQFKMLGIFKIFSPIVKRELQKKIVKDLEWLKELLENITVSISQSREY